MTKNEKKFVVISIITILVFLCLYSYRLVYYYSKEHPKNNDGSIYPKLYEKILTTYDRLNGLYKDSNNNSYYFYGDVDNNYVLFSGKLFRIISLDEDGNLKLISENSQTILANGKGYKKSYVRDWLNPNCDECGVFYKAINDKLLTYTTVYTDTVDNTNNITSKKSYDDSIGLLSMYEYLKAGAKTSYLINGEDWWLSTQTTNNETWYISNDELDKVAFDSHVSKGVRPTLTLNYNTSLISGNGTKEKPFIVEEVKKENLKDLYVGEKIKINDYIFKIVSKDNDNLKIKLDSYLELERNFDYEKNVFDITDTNSLAYYLNNKLLIDDKYLVSCPWNNGSYGIETYDYKTTLNNNFTSTLGLLSIGDFYINDTPSFLLNNKESLSSIYTVSEDKMIYEDEITTNLKISPVYCIDGNLKIESGNGYNEPYIIGGGENEA